MSKDKYYKDMRLSSRIKFNILRIKMWIFLKLGMDEQFYLTAKAIMEVVRND